MPTRPKGPCAVKSCPGRATNGRYCADHAKERRRKRRAPDNRPSPSKRGYGRNWQAKRAMYLKAHPNCVECGQPATEVDHIIPLAAGGTNEWVNLNSMCKPCHSRKTVLEDGGLGHGKKKTRADHQFSIRTRDQAARAKTVVVNLVGAPASGKTYVGRALAQALGLPFFSIDEERTAVQGPGVKWAGKENRLQAWVNLEDKIDGAGRCIVETSGLSGNDQHLLGGRRVYVVLCLADRPVRAERLAGRVAGGYGVAPFVWRYEEELLDLVPEGLDANMIFDTSSQPDPQPVIDAVRAWLAKQP
jgi:5-methylcytosine-specific restriction enzyme A